MILNNETVSFEHFAGLPWPDKISGKGGGRYFSPLPHHELLNLLQKEIEARSWKVGLPSVHLSKNYLDMAAVLPVTHRKFPLWEPDSYFVGVRNSNSQLYALHLYGGLSYVPKASFPKPEGGYETNLIVFWEGKLGKHTNRNTLPPWEDVLAARLDSWEFAVSSWKFARIGLQRKIIEQEALDKLLVFAARTPPKKGSSYPPPLVAWDKLGLIDWELQKKAKERCLNAEDVLLAFSAIIKRNYPLRQMDRLYRLYKLLLEI